MQKQAPSLPRIGAMVLFALSCFGLLLYLWMSFGGAVPLKPKGYRFQVALQEAGKLSEQADVRIAGVQVGEVVKKQADPQGNNTIATIELEDRYAPVKRDSRVILRQKTLLGETYVELTRGSPGAEDLPEGALLERNNVAPTVELDELLSTFDPFTRQAYRTWQQSLSRAVIGRGRDLNDSLGNLPLFVESGGDLLSVLDDQRGALQGVVKNTGVVFEALTEREDQLANLIVNSERVWSAINSQRDNFALVWQIFPTFLEESRLTYDRLRVFATATRPLLRELRPVADELGPTLRAVGDFGPDLRRLFINLDPLIDAQKVSLPATRQILRGLRPFLGAFGPWLQQVVPFLDWIGIHAHTLSDMFSNLGGATAATARSADPASTGHYLRQFGTSGAETVAMWPNRLSSNRGNAYLNPLSLTGPLPATRKIGPNWDCNNTGVGEKPPTTESGRSSPACWVQPPLDIDAIQSPSGRGFPWIKEGRFPQVGPADWSGR